MRVRGFNPFHTDLPGDSGNPWVDWITTSDVLLNDNTSPYFKRHEPTSTQSNQSSTSTVMGTTVTGPIMGSMVMGYVPLNNSVIADILAASRAMPSWKSCQVENTLWDGTGEENTKRYLALQGNSDV